MKIRNLFTAIITAAMLSACTGNGSTGDTAARTTEEQASPAEQESASPAERTARMARCYWENTDTAMIADKQAMQQAFLGYIAILESMPPQDAARTVKETMHDMERTPRLHRALTSLATHYLYNIESPLLNEPLYLPFAESAAMSSLLSEQEMARCMHRIDVARKNNPGNPVGDFAYTTPDGRQTTLHDTQGGMLLLMFHDPECDNCKQTLQLLSENGTIKKLIADGTLTPLLIYTEGDSSIWHAHKNNHPHGWLHGFDATESIKMKRIYELRAMPSIYLLDSAKRVLLKDVLPARLIPYLQSIATVNR